jgi:hypothetical protein
MVAPTEAYWWDAAGSVWQAGPSIDQVGSGAPPSPRKGFVTSMKRRIFPSTLWGSGRPAIAGARELLKERLSETVVLHTSYLSPLVARVKAEGARAFVDVHDVVSESHAADARHGPIGVRAVRHWYATRVRAQELAQLRLADGVAVAGWQDLRFLRDHHVVSAAWAPTGLEIGPCDTPSPCPIRIGFIGNFRHSPTAGAAAELLASPVARNPRFEIVLAGLDSDSWGRRMNATTLGPVDRVEEFYNCVHVVTLPATNPCGFKCKLGEAALAGKAVLTTLEGAAGYPPDLRAMFEVVTDRTEVTEAAVMRALDRSAQRQMRARFEGAVGRAAASKRYSQRLQS